MRIFKGLICLLLLLFPAAFVQAQLAGQSVTGESGITVTVEELMKRQQPETFDGTIKMNEERKIGRKPVANPNAIPSATYPVGANAVDGVGQLNTQSILSNFLAIELFESGSIPPDPMGDVSETQIGVVTNGRIKFFTKPTSCGGLLTTSTITGATPLANPILSLDLDAFFSDVRNNSSTTDPHMHFDRTSGRWFIICMNITEPSNRVLIAVSNSNIINDKSSFTFYQYQHDVGTINGQPDNGNFLDFPTLGVDKNALYIGGLIFNGSSYAGSSIYVIRKSSVLSGGPIFLTAFRRLGNASSGMFCAQGVSNDDANATLGYFVGVDAGLFSLLNFVVVNNPAGTPTISQSSLNVPSTFFPIDQAAFGSTKPLDAIDDRLVNAQLIRNKINNTRSIWTAHNMAVTSSGVANNSGDRNAVRWYQINVNGSNFSLTQSGTLFNNAQLNPIGYWMGSIAATGQGHAALGASVASTNNPVNVAIAGRYNSTAAGTLFAPVNATNYNQQYNQNTDPSDDNQRWGDYSQTIVDPADDMTMWSFQQYTTGTNRWGVRAIQIRAPAPATPLQLSGLACTPSGISNVTLNGSSSNNSGWFDPGNDFAKRLAVTSTGNVSISNVQFSSPTQLTFSINYNAAVPGSQQTLTITNPDCQFVTFQYTVPQGCALPVTWVDVNARYSGENAVINWEVANEEKLSHYEVQSSGDGARFTGIGTTLPLHAASATYTFTHNNAPDLVFYRIKQFDTDGKFSYSKTVSLKRAVALNTIQLVPNPAKTTVQIILPEAGGELRIIDAGGKSKLKQKPPAASVYINTSSWAKGMYIVEYLVSGRKLQEKLIIQ